MKVEVKVPAVGESITEGTIAQWNVKSGDQVTRDQVLLLLETDKASVEVVSEQSGKIEIKSKEGETVAIGSVVATIDTDAKGAMAEAKMAPSVSVPAQASAPRAAGASMADSNGSPLSATPLSPAVRRIVEEKQLNPQSLVGTGPGGRITKGDVLQVATAQPQATTTPLTKMSRSPLSGGALSLPEERVKMTTIRKRIAERLLEAQSTAAILTTFNEIDMSAVMDLRKRYKETFQEKYSVGLGFMGFFVRACIESLRTYPAVNAFMEGDEIVYHHYYNVGIAVGTPKGLIVPVLKNAELLTLAEIELAIKAYGTKARDGKIAIDDLTGGTFTITNGGVFGSLMSTPILNPPQTGILGMHKIQDRPMAINGQVVIRPMMYVALSYDHRIIDGEQAVSFLVKVKQCIEDPARLLLEI